MKVATDLVKFTKKIWYILLSQRHNLPRISMQAATNILVNHTNISKCLQLEIPTSKTNHRWRCAWFLKYKMG